MTDSTQQVIKGFEFRESIGTGGFGTVYRAYQSVVSRDVAIKVIRPEYANHPEFIRRFETEAQIVARLEHPHIVPLYDYWRDLSGAYLVMRWLPGSLRASLKSGPWSLEATVRLLDQIAAGLAVAHRHQIVHRDIKPDNILFDEDQNAYLADFGIAKILDTRTESSQQKQLVGSPIYMTPEQIRSEVVSPQTDLYSLGVVLYEMLTGDRPFAEATSTTALIYKHLNEPLPSLRLVRTDLPPALDGVIQMATAKSPDARYPDALRLAAAFRAAADVARPRSDQPLPEPLTERELEILRLMVEGCSNTIIAERLYLSAGTVKWYIKQIYAKLDVHSRDQAIERAQALNLTADRSAVKSVPVALPPVSAGKLVLEETAGPEVMPVVAENPYKGLQAFQEADASDFFGREALVDQLLTRLSEAGPYSRFLAIVGPSGSGKSSVVKAGLIPALRRGALPGSERWFVVKMLPGAHPLEETEIALTRVAAKAPLNIMEQLRRDERGLLRVVRMILPELNSQLLVVIDQFEELFTLVENPAEVTHFMDSLIAAVTDPHSPLCIIITLRADFYDRPLMYPNFSEMVSQRTQAVTPLRPEELEQAVASPAAAVGVAVEPGLVAAIVAEANEQPGALPLLQYALTELFEARQNHTLTKVRYDALGGALGALARRAEAIYAAFNASEKSAARQLFLRLVTLGEGTEDTRRRTPQSELLSVSGDSGAMQNVIDAFDVARLLTFDRDPITRGPTVEVAHEAILREWKQLRTWLDDSRDDVRLQRLLATAASQWLQANRDSSYLLTGSRLAQFEGWSATTKIALTQDEQAYLDASLAERQRQETAERERQAKELELAKQAAEQAKRAETSQRRAANRLRYLVIGIAVFLVVAIGLLIFALIREAAAERQAAVNQSLVWAKNAEEANAGGKTELGLLLALEAVKIPDPPVEAVGTLKTIALGAGSHALFEGHTSPVQTVAFSPDSKVGASGSCAQVDGKTCRAGEIILWDIQAKTMLRRLVGHADAVKSIVFTLDGRTLWSASGDGTILLWNVDPTSPAFGTSIHSIAPRLGSVNAIALNTDGSALLAGTSDGSVILLNVQTGEVIRRFSGHKGGVNSIAFSPDGLTILSGGDDNSVRLWKLGTGDLVLRFEGHTGAVVKVAFRIDGKGILSSSADGTLRLWDVATGKELHRLFVSVAVHDVAIKPDNRTVFVDYGGGNVGFLDLDGWRITTNLLGNPNEKDMDQGMDARAIAFDTSGGLALTGSEDGNVILWNTGLDRQVRRFTDAKVAGGFISLGVRSDGLRMVTGAAEAGEALYWDIDSRSPTNGKVLARLGGYVGLILPAVFSPDGRSAVIGSGDWYGETNAKRLMLWNLDETSAGFGKPIYTLTGITYFPRAAAFTPDGSKVLVGTGNLQGHGELAMWDVATGTLHSIKTGRDVATILVTPDGKRALTASVYFTDLSEWDIDFTSATFGKEIRHIATKGDSFDLQWGPTGTTILVGDTTKGLFERDYATGSIIRQFQGRSAIGVWTVSLSTDKRYVVTGDDVGEIALWDYQLGSEIWRSEKQEGYISYIAFAPDNQTVFSVAAFGLPVQWRMSEPSLAELRTWIPQNRYLRPFTCAERKQYRVEPLCDEGK